MPTDEILLFDMLLAAREAIDFLIDVSLEDFERDRMRQLAVIKSIETIGEAAAGISDAFRRAHPEIPWREIVGMRNRLVHGNLVPHFISHCQFERPFRPPASLHSVDDIL
ncbi:MAG: DUF86 domain-containing protein, partial [Planctomycetes bacterium]|nr:DUF86 domain-containing protein [Planctomycetota bacterium]